MKALAWYRNKVLQHIICGPTSEAHHKGRTYSQADTFQEGHFVTEGQLMYLVEIARQNETDSGSDCVGRWFRSLAKCKDELKKPGYIKKPKANPIITIDGKEHNKCVECESIKPLRMMLTSRSSVGGVRNLCRLCSCKKTKAKKLKLNKEAVHQKHTQEIEG
jgi:hypothetical protein